MVTNKLKQLGEYRKKLTALEKQWGKERRRLQALPGKHGFKSVDALIAALRKVATAAGAKAQTAAKPQGRRTRATDKTKPAAKKPARRKKRRTA